ncbi:uncharacterized protein PITG_08893 [Phytophthora infestans T30-4]|uniref:HAT C-terminal dimerisation domain-containing protein n=1 Tax=Phytophthora infestans (strain T30-4) TaxID=403677 RepID=D0NDF8_PHYIT|nr:uncharacterized protein PITG_08893 [Phytophthora infestans T30-4]EEY56115.1 conserved hypothetical protein [Phytophthora infestans T30-4]|eukprot:XP_002902945.1 conserved hypothetical protein [Phytophthora infestans T30-4]
MVQEEGPARASSATDKSRKDVESAEVDSASVLDLTRDPNQNQASMTSPDEARVASEGSASKPFFRVSEKTFNALVSKLLISQGLPYTLCESAAFKDLIRAATGNPAFQGLGCDRHDRLLNSRFQLFCELVGELLSTEFRFIAALACVKNDGRNTPAVAKVIEGSWDKIVTTVTPGGALYEGGDVIHKLRSLNNHFRSPKQRSALKKIPETLSYPELEDQDVHVAYTCKLIRRSVVNYAAFDAYLQSTKESTSSWSALTAKDWMLAVEMEAATNFIANLALVEVQSENLVSSYMVVFRWLAANKLKAFKFEAMTFEAPGAKDASEASRRRVTRTRDQFSDAGKTCLRRARMQLQARFPNVTTESMACVLLDPRTKSSAKKIAAVEWLEVTKRQSPKIKLKDLSKDMSIDAQSGMHYALLGLYKHIDVLKWVRDEGEAQFPSIALLARIHLGKISSSAFQERVFSTGGIVMGPLRTRTDSRRAERQLLLRHNRDEIMKMKLDARKSNESFRPIETTASDARSIRPIGKYERKIPHEGELRNHHVQEPQRLDAASSGSSKALKPLQLLPSKG